MHACMQRATSNMVYNQQVLGTTSFEKHWDVARSQIFLMFDFLIFAHPLRRSVSIKIYKATVDRFSGDGRTNKSRLPDD